MSSEEREAAMARVINSNMDQLETSLRQCDEVIAEEDEIHSRADLLVVLGPQSWTGMIQFLRVMGINTHGGATTYNIDGVDFTLSTQHMGKGGIIVPKREFQPTYPLQYIQALHATYEMRRLETAEKTDSDEEADR